MKTIVIIGASGYIGRNLVNELILNGGFRIKILSRPNSEFEKQQGVEYFEGDLFAPQSLTGLLEPKCIVVNLVYLWNGGQELNLLAMTHLLNACKVSNIKRLIHCSTAAVVGRVPDDVITELTPCNPISEYGVTKLKIERVIADEARGYFDSVILRPTSVFGPDGEPLRKLAHDLLWGNSFLNYVKTCIFGKRRMNLVHINNVIASVILMVDKNENLNSEVFIVSDDDSPLNNFADVERTLFKELRIKNYWIPALPLPAWTLKFLLACLGRNSINPYCNFDSAKIRSFGFKRPIEFDQGLVKYASWCLSSIPKNLKHSKH